MGGRKGTQRDLSKGPIKDRGCTDIICCILFLLYMLGMAAVGIIGFVKGDPKMIIFPKDSQGKYCGVDYKDRPYLYFFDITKCAQAAASTFVSLFSTPMQCNTKQICVKECPKEFWNPLTTGNDYAKAMCVNDYKPTSLVDFWAKMSAGVCAPYVLQSSPLANRCLPSFVTDKLSGLLNDERNMTFNGTNISSSQAAMSIFLNVMETSKQVVQNLKDNLGWIVLWLAVALVACLIYIVLMRCAAFPLIILTWIAILCVLGAGAYFSTTNYIKLKNSNTTEVTATVSNPQSWKDMMATSKKLWLSLAIICSVVGVILLLIFLFMAKRTFRAVILINEAGRALFHMPSALFFPILLWVMQIVWLIYFAAVLVFLLTSSKPQYQARNSTVSGSYLGGNCDPTDIKSYTNASNLECLLVSFGGDKVYAGLSWFHLFGYLWGLNFILAFGQCSLAGAFASYYWTLDKSDVPFFPVVSSMWRCFRYHMGSLAFGAAIVAIIQFIRIILEYIDNRLKGYTNNPLVGFLLKCCKCCCWCLENCMRFINKNAYIEIAVYGQNFCTSAKNAFLLLAKNPLQLLAVTGTSGFIILTGRLLIMSGVGLAAYYQLYGSLNPVDFNVRIASLAVVVVGSYVVSVIFFSVFSMGIDTIFLCYLEDIEHHDGSAKKPYYMSKALRKALGVKNEKPAEE